MNLLQAYAHFAVKSLAWNIPRLFMHTTLCNGRMMNCSAFAKVEERVRTALERFEKAQACLRKLSNGCE
jgi:hypothetical protein